MRQISIDAITEAAQHVYKAAVRTPLDQARPAVCLDRRRRHPRSISSSSALQPIGSFKIRGAWNAVRKLTPEQMKDGVWTVSAGNAAQGVAFAARLAGVPCSVMVMDTAPQTKLRLDRAARRDDRQGQLRRMLADGRSRTRSARMRGHFVHPFDDDDFIAGNATAGLEILEDLPDVDAVVAALGGGGLLCGHRRGDARAQARRQDLRRRAGNRGAARTVVARAAKPSYFDAWKPSFVDGAGGKSVLPTMWPLLKDAGRRLDRHAARRDRRRDAQDRRARPRRRRRRRRHAPSPRRSAAAPAPEKSSPSCPAATSISFAHSLNCVSAHAVTVNHMSEERFANAAPLPDRLHRLHELALDLWWSWDDRARLVFRQLDYALWRATAHNPVQMLQRITAERLQAAARIRSSSRLYDEAIFGLDQARAARRTRGGASTQSMLGNGSIAYFSAEFALHQSLPIYAGGLGVLAGDHCKEASDLGLPFVGIGFMYPQGYFRQRMTNDGWQEERYERISWTDAPIEAAITPDGRPCIIAVPLGDRTVLAAVWRVRLGRVRLFLLDTDLAENAPWDRELSARLYGGDRETRIQQEIILGIGGVRALRALGHRADGVAPQRRPRRVRRAAAHPRDDRAGRVVRRRARRGAGARRCSRRTRRCPPATTRFRFSWSRSTSPAVGRDRPASPEFPRPRRIRQRQRLAVQHDGAGAAHRRRSSTASARCTAR